MEIVVKRCGCSLWVRIERHHVISKMNTRTIMPHVRTSTPKEKDRNLSMVRIEYSMR